MKRQLLAGVAVLLSFPAWSCLLHAQTNIETYGIFSDHPRLFLRPQRLRLLRREAGRKSLRWDQFQTMLSGGAPMTEPGFANALYFRVTDDRASGRRAVDWALAPGRDLRQVALVYDWCQDLLTPPEKQKLGHLLHDGLGAAKNESISSLRSRILAAIALGDDDAAVSEAALREAIQSDWLGRIIPAMKAGTPVFRNEDTYPLLEMFHAVRDSLNADLREDYPAYFKQLPLFDLLSYYPPPYPAAENQFHIPFSGKIGEPDLRLAALSRAGELAMVAFDTNAPESQVLQGWLMNDNFLMRGAFGIPYEFLWANPYQPGLSYYHVPLVLHDEIFGRLLVRSSWDDDAGWAGYENGKLQEFRDGRVVPLDPKATRPPLDLDEAAIFFGSQAHQLESGAKDANDIFIVGLKPHTAYHVEVDDEEMQEMNSAAGGILYLKGVRPKVSVRFTPRLAAADWTAQTGR